MSDPTEDEELLLRMAILGARSLITKWKAELNQTRDRPQEPESPDKKHKKHNISPEGRKAIVEGTKKRWAEFHRKKAEAQRRDLVQ